MTSPRQRKKRLVLKKLKERLEKANVVEHKTVVVEAQAKTEKTEPVKPVASVPPAVVESEVAQKQKKPKAALVEPKSQDQVVEQQKEEVKTQTKG
jgi:hypothetical protein